MKNSFKNQSAIKLQIIYSYLYIYLYLFPRAYLDTYRKKFGSLVECIIISIFFLLGACAIVLGIINYFTIGVHYSM